MVVLFPMKASASWLHDEFANRKFATLCCFTCMGACLLPQRAWTTHAYGGRTRRAVVSKMGLVRRCMWSSSPRCFAKTGPVQRTNRDLLSRTTWQHTTNPVSQSHGQRGTFKPHFIASWTQPEGHAAAMRGSPATRVTESCCDVRGQLCPSLSWAAFRRFARRRELELQFIARRGGMQSVHRGLNEVATRSMRATPKVNAT